MTIHKASESKLGDALLKALFLWAVIFSLLNPPRAMGLCYDQMMESAADSAAQLMFFNPEIDRKHTEGLRILANIQSANQNVVPQDNPDGLVWVAPPLRAGNREQDNGFVRSSVDNLLDPKVLRRLPFPDRFAYGETNPIKIRAILGSFMEKWGPLQRPHLGFAISNLGLSLVVVFSAVLDNLEYATICGLVSAVGTVYCSLPKVAAALDPDGVRGGYNYFNSAMITVRAYQGEKYFPKLMAPGETMWLRFRHNNQIFDFALHIGQSEDGQPLPQLVTTYQKLGPIYRTQTSREEESIPRPRSRRGTPIPIWVK